MVYNLTNLTNANNILEQTIVVNQLTDGLFYILVMFIIFMIILIANINREDIRKILIGDSLIIILLCFLGLAIGLINWWIIIFPITIFISSLIALLISQ